MWRMGKGLFIFQVTQEKDFVMEVTDKTRSDIKGGTLIKYGETPLRLLEIAQVPKEHVWIFPCLIAHYIIRFLTLLPSRSLKSSIPTIFGLI